MDGLLTNKIALLFPVRGRTEFRKMFWIDCRRFLFSPSPLLPNFLFTPGVLLRACSLTCSIKERKRLLHRLLPVAEIRRELKRRLRFLTPDAFNIASRLTDHILKKTKTTSHINFIGRCLKKKVIPVGFRIKFHASTANDQRVASITKTCSRQLMQTTLHSLKVRQANFSSSIAR